MSTINPFEQAAIPTAIAVLQAGEQFMTDMGSDPAKWALNYAGAKLKELGSIQLALGQLPVAEGGVIITQGQALIQNWIKALQAAQAAQAK